MSPDAEAVTIDELLAHRRWVRALARSLVADPGTADDIEQQTWMAALENPPSRRGNLRAWLARIVRRRSVDANRSAKRRADREGSAPSGRPVPSPDALASRAETQARVAQAVLGLKEPYRTTVLLRFFEEMAPRDIAAHLDVPVETVRTRLGRAVVQLRTQLERDLGGTKGGWRHALLPVAGLAPALHAPAAATSTATATMGTIAMTTQMKIAWALVAVLLLLGTGLLARHLLRDDQPEPEIGITDVSRSGEPTLRGSPDALRKAGTSASRDPTTPAPNVRSTVEEAGEASAGVVAGRVEDEKGRPCCHALVMLYGADPTATIARQRPDARGEFRFEELDDESHTIVVLGPGDARARRVVRPGGALLLVTLEVASIAPIERATNVRETEHAPGGVVGGTVLGADGVAVEGAQVRLWDGPALLEMVETGADGTFEFAKIYDRWYVLSVFAEGHLRVRHPVQPGDQLLEVALERAPSISGIIVEEGSGRPVAGMFLTTRDKTPVMARTEEDGTFLLTGLAPGPYELEIGIRSTTPEGPAAEYVMKRVGPVTAGTTDLRIEMTRGLAIEGVIQGPDGAPWIGGARVRMSPVAYEGRVDYMGQRVLEATLAGTFRMPGLAAGSYDLTVEPTGAEEADVSTVHVPGIAAGTYGLVVCLTRGALLVGRLVDETEDPVLAEGWLWVMPAGKRAGEPGTVAARLLEGGRFEAGPFDPSVALDLQASGFRGYQVGGIEGAHAGGEPLEIVLVKGLAIRGRVRIEGKGPPPAGTPVEARVQLPPVEAGALEVRQTVRTKTDAGGAFLLGGLADVPYRVIAGGGTSGLVGKTSASGVKPSTENVEIVLVEGIPFSGRLVDDAGNPLAPLVLRATPMGAAHARDAWVWSRPDGGFVFRGVPAGEVRLGAMIQGEYRILGTFTAPAKDVEVVVER